MGRQRGALKITATLGDVNFYKSQDGFLVREKGGVDGKRIKSDPAFKRTRENGQEFGSAGKAGKLLRIAFRSLLLNSDNRVVSRLVRDFLKVIQSDPLGARGLRRVMAGNVVLMRDFEFNIRAPFSSMFYAPYTVVIDRVAGTVTVEVPAFSPFTLLQAPMGTTHFKSVSGGAAVDFDARTFVAASEESAFLPWDINMSPVLNHVHSFPANSIDPLFVMMGISFYQEVNGEMYALNDGSFNCRALVEVEAP